METYPLKLLDTGITYTATLPGLVPQIEEREAGRFSGYTWKEWGALPYEEKVECVAYFRVKRRIDMHQRDAQDTDMQRKIKTQQRKAKRRK